MVVRGLFRSNTLINYSSSCNFIAYAKVGNNISKMQILPFFPAHRRAMRGREMFEMSASS